MPLLTRTYAFHLKSSMAPTVGPRNMSDVLICQSKHASVRSDGDSDVPMVLLLIMMMVVVMTVVMMVMMRMVVVVMVMTVMMMAISPARTP